LARNTKRKHTAIKLAQKIEICNIKRRATVSIWNW
jgi:hypothetical protein